LNFRDVAEPPKVRTDNAVKERIASAEEEIEESIEIWLCPNVPATNCGSLRKPDVVATSINNFITIYLLKT
jgi:hypothetical protein